MLAARNAEYLAQVQGEIEAAGGRALAVPTNLVDAEQVAALVDRTVDAFGRLDGLVNNAFRMDTFQPFETVDLAKWRKIFEVNVWGALGLTQACLPHLKKAAADARRRVGRVHHLDEHAQDPRSSRAATRRRRPRCRPRPRRWRWSSGPTGVRVNCVAPGWIGGPNVETFIGWESESRGISRDDVRAEIEARIPLRLIPPQDDIANASCSSCRRGRA